jgi:hypothetical protein
MAYITVVSGGAQPVFATDVLNPVAANAATSGTPVNLQGPKLDFFYVTANNSVANQQNASQYVSNVIAGLQRVSTVAMYQVDGTQISFATYPAGAFGNIYATDSTKEIDPAIVLAYANVTYTGFQLSGAASAGFLLTD